MAGDGLGAEAPNRGHIMLRDSANRFFTPHYSGPNHEYRQQILTSDGVKTPQFTSILQLGKKDLPSYGVEDQFSKSQYTSKPLNATLGLCESRVPGKYTPRKQFTRTDQGGVAACLGTYNPSGDPAVTAKWGKGVDLNVTLNSANMASTGPSMTNYGGYGMSHSMSSSSIFG
jgi:hypothetical protein